MLPTQEQQEQFQMIVENVPFGAALGRDLRILESPALSDVDEKGTGRREIEGLSMVFEGKVTEGMCVHSLFM
jgi:hypothetical protein